MATKVSNDVPMISSDKLEWKLTKKVDPQTGKPIGAETEREGPKTQLQGLVDRSVSKDLKIQNKELQNIQQTSLPEVVPSSPKTESVESEHLANYQKMQGEAKSLAELSQGKPKEVGDKKEATKQGEAKVDSPRVYAKPEIKEPRVVAQPAVKLAANEAKARDIPPQNIRGEEVKNRLQEKAVEHAKAGKEANSAKQGAVADQAAVATKAPEAKESKQLKEKIADNNNEREKSKKSGSTSAGGKAKSASRELGNILAGGGSLGSSTTTTQDDVEVVADAVEPSETRKKLSIEFYNAEEADAKVVENAAEYRNVEQVLKRYVELDKKVENYTVKELAQRVIVETKEAIAAANLLIEQLRSTTRGRGSASGFGMAA